MRGQLVIDVETGENMAFIEEIGLCVKPELGSLGACHFHVTHIVSDAATHHAGEMSRENFGRRVDFRAALYIPERIATFAKAYAAAELARSHRRQESVAETPYAESGPYVTRDLTSALFAPYSPQHQELERQKHGIGRELHILLAKARGLH